MAQIIKTLTTEDYRKNDNAGKYTDHKDHGLAFDRGSADSWYSRSIEPHYWTDGSYGGEQIVVENMTQEEVEAYLAGYHLNEEDGGKKDWN
jgi:hypothetical protein